MFDGDKEPPEPDYSDPKEVYAFFGLASYAAQVLERGVVNLAVSLHAAGLEPATPNAIDSLFDRFEPKTLGKLLEATSKATTLPTQLEDALRTALSERNRLAHRFFWDHAENLLSEVGRRLMIDELREAVRLFFKTDRLVEPILLEIFETFGLSKERIEEEHRALLRRVNQEGAA